MESIVNDFGYDLSSHCYSKINKNILEKRYYEKYEEEDALRLIDTDRKNVNCIILKIINDIMKGKKYV